MSELPELKNSIVEIRVENLTRSLDFYVGLLGFELEKKYGEYYAELKGPGIRIGLHPVENRRDNRSPMSIGFSVGDVDTIAQRLRAEGAEVGIGTDGPIRLGHFVDPDGTELFLAENER